MRNIDGAGAVSNKWVDYDSVSNPDGTVFTADFGNDVQDELRAIEEHFSIDESAGSNGYVLAAIKGMAIKFGKQLGEYFYLNKIKDPVAFDKDSPESFFPAICLDTIDGYENISEENWSELVSDLRARALTYAEGTDDEKSTFSVTDWEISSGTATLSLDDLTAENAMLEALSEDNLVHGSFTNWRSVTLNSDIGDISAGEYAITDIDTTNRTISFSSSESDNSGSGDYSVNFYTNRIPDSTTKARVFQASARTLMSANDANGYYVNGLRKRDAMQRITGTLDSSGSNDSGTFAYGGVNDINLGTDGTSKRYFGSTDFDSANSTSPNTAKTDDEETRPKAMVGHLYLWGRSYAT